MLIHLSPLCLIVPLNVLHDTAMHCYSHRNSFLFGCLYVNQSCDQVRFIESHADTLTNMRAENCSYSKTRLMLWLAKLYRLTPARPLGGGDGGGPEHLAVRPSCLAVWDGHGDNLLKLFTGQFLSNKHLRLVCTWPYATESTTREHRCSQVWLSSLFSYM